MSETPSVLNLALVAESHARVRELTGFRKKTHRVPDEYTDRTQAFVWKIANEDLGRDLDERFAEFRKHFRFKRADLIVHDPENGCGAIATPWFVYRVTINQSEDDATAATWRRQVTEFGNPKALFSSEFATVFGRLFDSVEFEPPQAIDMEEFIDAMEDREDESMSIEFDRTATWCELQVDQIPGNLMVESDRITLVSSRPDLPVRLLEAFFEFRERLTGIECFRGDP